jgi:predicted MFS family arabinose efflux permease
MGHVLGTTLLARYGDIVGRIPMLRIALTCSVIIYGMIIFISRWSIFTYALLFLFGIFANLRVNLGFIYGQETVKSNH